MTSVSADLLSDEASGEEYYLARVELVETQAASIDLDALYPGMQAASIDLDALYPGMQAEVMIVTGERTVLDYILAPFSRSIDRALRED